MTNYCVQDEIKGFEFAMRFFNTPARRGFSKQMVRQIALELLNRYSQTRFYCKTQGFYNAAMIIANTREDRQEE